MSRPCQVLLVDDVPANLLALESMLGDLNCGLVRANSGEEALRHILSNDFAVIVLDLQMPTMGGFEVARMIRGRPRSIDTPIIFVTASDPSEFPIEEAYTFGAVDYLTKPVNATVLRAKVKFFIDLHRKSVALEEMQKAQTAAALKAKDDRIRLILDNTRDFAFILTGIDGTITEWDGAAETITGWNATDVIGENIAMMFTAEDLAAHQPEIEKTCARNTGRAEDKRWHMKRDGTRFFADGVMISLNDPDGRIKGFAKIFRDVTQSKLQEVERERLLKDAETAHARLMDVFKQAPAFMCVVRGPNHVFEIANDRYLQLVGQRDLIGKPVREALPEVAGQGFFELLDRVYQTGESFVGTDLRLVLQRPDGSQDIRFVDFVYMAVREAADQVSGILVHGVDLTDRKMAEQALRTSEERYRTVIESIDEGFCVIEMLFDESEQAVDYRFIETNPVFEKQTGLQGVVGKRVLELVPDLDGHWFEIYGKVALTGEPIRFLEESRPMDRWFDVYATRLGGDASRMVALVFSDVTERRRAEDDLRNLAAQLSESNRRKSEFLATLAHELRNPLAPIRTGLEIIRRTPGTPASVDAVREMMGRQVNHMVHLVDDLLDIARITTGKVDIKKERVELRTLVKAAVETSAPAIEASQHNLDLSLPDELLYLDADPTRIAQVLSNLLTNAAKYTPNQGQIELLARREAKDVIISVSDTGIGIPQDAIPTVFDMFNQVDGGLKRSQGGLGIGLSLVRQLVELHDGQVEAKSAGSGKGSTFVVRLPLAVEQAEVNDDFSGMDEQMASTAAHRKGLRILIADDNVDAASSLSSWFQLCGHHTFVVHDGFQALKEMDEFVPDLTILDIGMPGLNGYEVAKILRKKEGGERAILLALTGWGETKDREMSERVGFNYHLTKPVHIKALEKILLQIIPAD